MLCNTVVTMHSYNSWILWVFMSVTCSFRYFSLCLLFSQPYMNMLNWKKTILNIFVNHIKCSFYFPKSKSCVAKNCEIFTLREWAWKSQYIAIVPSSSSFFISCFTWQIKIIWCRSVFSSIRLILGIIKGQKNIFHESKKQNEYYLKDWGKGLFYHILVLAV